MTYLSSMNTFQLVEESPSYGNILVSVKSTPQCEIKEHSDLMAIDEDVSTEDEAQSLQLDAFSTDQNISPDNAKTPDELNAIQKHLKLHQ